MGVPTRVALWLASGVGEASAQVKLGAVLSVTGPASFLGDPEKKTLEMSVIGGLLLGLLEAFAAGYVSSQYKDAVAFLVIGAAIGQYARASLSAMPRA